MSNGKIGGQAARRTGRPNKRRTKRQTLRRNRGRPVTGLLLLDKPAGMRSNQALQRVKRLFQAQKAGHTGSLDNSATGLLPLCLGAATRFAVYLLEADKRYVARCRLGAETTTGDAEGEVTQRTAVPALTEARLRSVLAEFVGEISQVPPMFSALKQGGQPLYKLAYAGKETPREPRTIRIAALTLDGFTDDTLSISVACSKGTYIRTLAQDIGRRLGCGAHVEQLRRTASGPFTAAQMISLATVEERAVEGLARLDALLLPIDTALAPLPAMTLPPGLARPLCRGQAVTAPQGAGQNIGQDIGHGMVRLYCEAEGFLGVGEARDDGRIVPKRLLHYG